MAQHYESQGVHKCWERENPEHNARCGCTNKEAGLAPKRIPPETVAVLEEVAQERLRQDQKWGPLSYRVGMNARKYEMPEESRAKQLCETASKDGTLTWGHILVEELAEALDSFSEAEQERELVQLAAVAIWAIEDLRRAHRK